jgi:hypothetical protein
MGVRQRKQNCNCSVGVGCKMDIKYKVCQESHFMAVKSSALSAKKPPQTSPTQCRHRSHVYDLIDWPRACLHYTRTISFKARPRWGLAGFVGQTSAVLLLVSDLQNVFWERVLAAASSVATFPPINFFVCLLCFIPPVLNWSVTTYHSSSTKLYARLSISVVTKIKGLSSAKGKREESSFMLCNPTPRHSYHVSLMLFLCL